VATVIDVLNAGTFDRLPTIKAPGVYRPYPSPDGRWLFGITNFAGPSLDIFDLEADIVYGVDYAGI
jgi:hypothetical protein